ncbi:MAG: carbohydrate ABC transporter permease [Epulopiscium sp.]|nr:carbohydrate ABC transporter permease [Candidatus Epulonipiscium sp.]
MKRFTKITIYLVLIALSICFLIPVIWVLLSSFKSGAELFSWPPTIWPEKFILDNFQIAFKKGNFGLYFWNSTYSTILATLLTLLINTMAGYALAKFEFKGRNLFFIGFISTLMIPLEVIMIPIFQVLKTLRMYNRMLGIIIPPAATPTGVFLMRQYLLSVPDSLLEAARIDGAGEWKLFSKIIMPIAKPVLAVLTIFSFMWRWNDFLWPLLVINDPNLYTVQLAIANFTGQFSVDWNSLLAMAVVTMIPVLIVFLIFQKQFVRGMVISGMKE